MIEIRPFLWYPGCAQEAFEFYERVFEDSEIVTTVKADMGTGERGLIVGRIRLHGFEMQLFNGPAEVEFTHAFSLMIVCDTQEEIDRHWDGLLDGGETMACGWLRDRFGLSWQVTPRRLLDFLASDDLEASARARDAMLSMVKLDLPALEAAFAGDAA
jgi:predicted 3-demethylubiquinone-9 3-methyltransferase (glyoxalase superfamily)